MHIHAQRIADQMKLQLKQHSECDEQVAIALKAHSIADGALESYLQQVRYFLEYAAEFELPCCTEQQLDEAAAKTRD